MSNSSDDNSMILGIIQSMRNKKLVESQIGWKNLIDKRIKNET